MVELHDFVEFPELTDKQLQEMPFDSPHEQVTGDFECEVVAVHDGDTIRVKWTRRTFTFPVRFLDIDAPEMNEGGETARDWLRGRILGETITVRINPKNKVDKYGRLLGHIFHAGMNVGEEELRLGLAIDFNRRNEGKLPDLIKMFSLKQWL